MTERGNNRPVILGIMGAMPEEVASVVAAMEGASVRTRAGREFRSGTLDGRAVVLAESRWGKVAAATTATHLIATFDVSAILFTGVAGALDPSLRIGDIVIARDLYQHDLDASPIFPPMQIPHLGVTALRADRALTAALAEAAERFASQDLASSVAAPLRAEFSIDRPRVLVGDVATGDRFIADAAHASELRGRLPSAACAEMEGAAVAQVCCEHRVPFAVVRTISDTADHDARVDFPRFLSSVAGAYALGITRRFVQST